MRSVPGRPHDQFRSASATRTAVARRRARRSVATAVAGAVVHSVLAVVAPPARAEAGHPEAPPARICGNAAVLDGPATPPAGAVRVDPGQDLSTLTQAKPPGTTFWLAPGTHRLGSEPLSQVIPKDNNAYVGAPGAVLDGGRVNRYAFTQQARGVTIRHLTIQNFGPPGTNNNEGVVNHDSGTGWTVEFNTIRDNAGAGVMIGNDNLVRSNCLADNGQYGFSTFIPDGIRNITLDRNEIAGNNRDDWETRIPYCGCSGAGKFWDVTGAVITNNWVHHNFGAGIWADTNNVGFRIEGNYINDNDAEGIFYEISYNARIVNNTLKRNALVKGREFEARGENFPIGAIYISESGGDGRVYGGVYATLEISGNLLEDNWGGVVLWENADRFCNSAANTSSGYCTKVGAASFQTCVAGTIDAEPYLSDCRWKTQNTSVHHNQFRMDKAAIGCAGGCGHQAVLSNWGTFPDWSPYKARVVQDAITYNQNNRFASNTYVGDWRFLAYETNNYQTFSSWQSSFGQDSGSTWSPPAGSTPPPPPSTTTTTVAPSGNALDPATSTLEEGVGQWVPWFSAGVSVTSEQAHSGSRSLKVEVTAPHGWGVTQANWPGFAAGPGPRTIRFAGRAGSGSPGATMWVRWRDGNGAELRTDSVAIASLTTTWQTASASVTAPAGTARVGVDFTSSSGVAGNTLYLDDVAVETEGAPAPTTTTVPPTTTTKPPTTTTTKPPTTTTTTVPPTTTTTVPPTTTTTRPPTTTTTTRPPTTTTTVPAPAANLLDADTAGLEGSAGVWVPWFSASAAPTTEQARGGARSLKVSVTAPHGWGVTQSNWPGFPAAAGEHVVKFWARAGAGSGLGATMWVHWRSADGSVLRTDSVTLPGLGSAWASAGATVTAPAGTARVAVDFTNSAGVAGNTLYIDDVTVGPAPPAVNLLDAATSTLEGSAGTWVPWFSADAASSAEQAHGGSRSLKVTVTAPHGWGVTQSNWPGVPATPGQRTIGFWGRAGNGSGLAATMWVHWRDAAGADIRVDSLTLPLGSSWAEARATVTAPAGTARVAVDFTNSAGTAGNTLYLDDIVILG